MMKLSIQQYDTTDCGAACLASVARYYRLRLPLWDIRRQAGTNKGGTSAYGLIKAAESLGFDAKGVEIDLSDLKELPLPAIAHLQQPSGSHHFVVIYGVSKKQVKVMDPAFGRMERMPLEAFKTRWTGVVILLIPSVDFNGGDKTVSNYRRFWNVIKPHRAIFMQSGLGALVFSILGLSTAFYIQKLTDFVLVGHNQNLLHLLGVIMLIIFAIQLLIGVLQSWFVLRVSQNIDTSLISGYFRHLIKLPQKFYDSMRIGELISRVNDAVKIRNFINQVAVEAVVDILIIIIAFLVMMVFSMKLALLSYAVIPIYLLLFLITNAVNRRLERAKMEETAELEIQLVESLRAVKTIKQMGAEEHFANGVDNRLMAVLQKVYSSGKLDIFSSSGMQFINRVLTLVILWAGAGLVIDTELSAGELMSFFAISAYFTGPVARLAAINKSVHGALIAMDRLFELLELKQENADKPAMPFAHEDVGDIVFTKVHFSYTLEQDLFQDFSMRIKSGGIAVLLGDSGSGKSTIGALIQGLYPVNSGSISIGKHDVAQINLTHLRRVVGIVPQNIELFTGNVIENIALGDAEPDINRIRAIIQQLGLEETIEQLPEGYYTWLGENAAQLSGGQRQRLAIARMLYLNPQVYIFDEATSFLDDRSEAIVKELIISLKKAGKTIIMVAHRMSVINIADEVFVFGKGEVIQSGSVKELKADKKGRFYEMWKHHWG
ncbi:peptidase domain-containing ABC transporter [Carboxylicivirga sediminis]|uniref:Peptidase domain-containing ABC transporter n=1 Tax=Carboxylicivirga sediminis TaxID=2006564 RepID=A0A941F6B1_9BACT|nr:peptidase domain-containing ABC transporter [Carboxylicivirga sediminis]MBR8536753.1 peptidase domain-containing ABC transporter [Carboxylicivirga sediminis]